MSCLSQPELQQLLRQKLPASALALAEKHISECKVCQTTLDALTATPSELTGNRHKSDLTTTANKDPTLQRLLQTLYDQPPALEPISEPSAKVAELPQRIGEYRILRLIAKGGGGILYEAIDTRLNRRVAIKVLHESVDDDPELRRRFDREARAVAAVRHENIVDLYDIGSTEAKRPYLVMEYVDGETLADRLAQEKSLPPRIAAEIVAQMGRALTALHEKGLIHRDVKPSNILLAKDNGQAKLTDFGLVLPEDNETRLTMEGTLAGTPDYMSPEQVRNPHLVDHRTDVYGLGTVLYESLTGQPPFGGVQRMTLLQILHDEPRSPRQLNDSVPRDLETICLTCLEKEPGRRYRTAADLVNDLENWLNGRPVAARPIGWLERCGRWCRRNPRIAALAATVVILLSVLAIGSSVAAVRVAKARDQANRQRDVALKTIRSLVFKFHDELESGVMGVDEMQMSILQSVLDRLMSIPHTSETSELINSTRVAALTRMGGIAYRQSDNEAALEYLTEAMTFADELTVDADPELLKSLARLHWYTGMIYLNSGNDLAAAREFEATVELEQRRVDDPSLDDWDARDIAVTRHRLARCYCRLKDWNAVEEQLAAVGDIRKRITRQELLDRDEIDLMLLHADLKQAQGNSAAARRLQEQAIAKLEQWLVKAPQMAFKIDFDLGDVVTLTHAALSATTSTSEVDWWVRRRSELDRHAQTLKESRHEDGPLVDWLTSQEVLLGKLAAAK